MPSQFSLSYFDPPADLARHVLATFYFHNPQIEIEDRHPGALSQLVVFPTGEGGMQFGGRFDPAGPGAFAFSGFSSAKPLTMRGPWSAIGASLTPLGWAALMRKPANEYFDRFIPAEELLGKDVMDFSAALIRRFLAGEVDGEAACKELSNWIASRLNKMNSNHEKLIEATIGWLGTSLNPVMDDLFEGVNYSRRQTERLVERYFGLPPAALARKYRAIRAAALLANDNLSNEAEAEIGNAFVDQPHMIREIRRFCGYTPSRLGGPRDPLFQVLLQMKNLDRLKEFRAIG